MYTYIFIIFLLALIIRLVGPSRHDRKPQRQMNSNSPEGAVHLQRQLELVLQSANAICSQTLQAVRWGGLNVLRVCVCVWMCVLPHGNELIN